MKKTRYKKLNVIKVAASKKEADKWLDLGFEEVKEPKKEEPKKEETKKETKKKGK